ERVKGLFGRRRPGRPGEIDVPDTPQAHQRHQTHLDDARGKRVKDMDPDQFGAEMREAGKNRPKRIEPGSTHHRESEVEIEANGHTYRRRRDGKGWCRFSPGPGECGISDNNLPPSARQKIREFEGEMFDEFDDPDIRDLDPETRRMLAENDRLMREQGA